MKAALTLSASLAAALLLAGCDKPAQEKAGKTDAAAPAASSAKKRPVRGAEPIQWDDAQKTFVMGGQALETAKLWTFETATEGFVGAGSTLSVAPDGGLKVVGAIFDPIVRSPKGLDIDGSKYNTVLVRLSRVKETARWDGTIFWATGAHAESASYMVGPVRGADPAVGETTTMVYDMSKPLKGGDDWVTSTINSLRLDLDDDIGGEFVIHQVAIVNVPGGAAPAKKPAAQ